MLSFDFPWALILLPLPWLVYRFLPGIQMDTAALKAPFITRITTKSDNAQSLRASNLKLLFLSIAWLLLVVAAARPVSMGEPVAIKQNGRDLMLAVDISESMARADMQIENQRVPRIIAVKVILSDFIEKRKGDQIGLILFGSNAYLQAPLTYDTDTVAEFLMDANLKLAGPQTAIGDAIGLAVKRLHERPESQRVLILLTDGENTAGELAPYESLELAKKANVKIYSVAVGPSVFSNIDERMLSTISKQTGGQYFNARNSTELQAIYEHIDNIETIENDEQFYRPKQPLFYIPLLCSLLLLIALLSIQSRWSTAENRTTEDKQ